MMNEINFVLQVGIPVALIAVGFVVGRTVEVAHLKRLDRAEGELSHIMISDMKRLPSNWHATEARLVTGTAVIATDYFKVFAAALRNLFGGSVAGYESLMSRARREAVVRMRREARSAGANIIWNVRIETSTITGQSRRGGVEVIVYGTAMRVT